MNTIYSTKEINPDFYMELGTDENYVNVSNDNANYAVMYVYKNGDLFDWHFTLDTTFAAEMMLTIQCYKSIHNAEPPIKDIMLWRHWFKMLKTKGVIS